MRKLFLCFGLWLGFVALAATAETLTLTDGSSFTGDVVKFDDNGLMLRATGDVYTNLPWGRFSQESLLQLAQTPKIKLLVEPFILPTESQRPAKPEIKVNPVVRLQRPDHPALIGGLVASPVGLCILLVLYLANLYAGFEVAVVRARSIPLVMCVCAVLPVIGQIIFLSLPVQLEAEPDLEPLAEDGTPGTTPVISIGDASWKQPEEVKKPQALIYARGKFTFNKRFLETKFAGFASAEPAGDAKNYSMEVKTPKESIAIERITQITATGVVFETAQRGPVTVPFTDIQEIKLNPKAAV